MRRTTRTACRNDSRLAPSVASVSGPSPARSAASCMSPRTANCASSKTPELLANSWRTPGAPGPGFCCATRPVPHAGASSARPARPRSPSARASAPSISQRSWQSAAKSAARACASSRPRLRLAAARARRAKSDAVLGRVGYIQAGPVQAHQPPPPPMPRPLVAAGLREAAVARGLDRISTPQPAQALQQCSAAPRACSIPCRAQSQWRSRP